MEEDKKDLLVKILAKLPIEKMFWAIGLSFVSAITVNIFLSGLLLKQLHLKASQPQVRASLPSLTRQMNYRSLMDTVKTRNIFNAEGEFPDEAVPEEETEPSTAFSAEANCNPTTLNLSLVGTIYIGGTSSIASIMEKGYSQADNYVEGDAIIGNEQAQIFSIQPGLVILNNDGRKECLRQEIEKLTGNSEVNYDQTSLKKPKTPTQPQGGGSELVPLSEDYVVSQLGDGFEKILDQGRLIPHSDSSGQHVGFKMIGVKPGGIFDKVGLQNGDILTVVNNKDLKNAELGFALYEAFQDEVEINVSYLRDDQPKSVTIQISP